MKRYQALLDVERAGWRIMDKTSDAFIAADTFVVSLLGLLFGRHYLELRYGNKGELIMELRVLRYFLLAAREENITKAAELLHVTQPTLSQQLMQLM